MLVFPSEIKSQSDSTAGMLSLTCSSYLNLLAFSHFYPFTTPLRTAHAVQNSSVVSHCEHIYQDNLNVYLPLKEICSFSKMQRRIKFSGT